MPPGFLARPQANAVRLGTELPPGIGLRPVPDDLAARVPQTKDYSYAVTHDRMLLVGTSRVVAGVFADARQNFGSSDPPPLERVLSDLRSP
jgi:hypothetical protein